MTDKRFRCVFKEHENKNSWSMIKDNQLDKPLYIKDVVDLLNFQNTQIKVLKELLNKLDDKNKQLREENEQLRGINKEIGDDLYNCRLNKDIVSEKLKLWQDAHKEYNIYSIKDFEESFELDAKINKEKGI